MSLCSELAQTQNPAVMPGSQAPAAPDGGSSRACAVCCCWASLAQGLLPLCFIRGEHFPFLKPGLVLLGDFPKACNLCD